MDTLTAAMMGEIFRDNEMKVFDWDKAAKIIKERGLNYAEAGLLEDWEWTGGTIMEDGDPVYDDFPFLASTWATPTLRIDDEYIQCFVMEHETEWDAKTRWPESALKILEEETVCLRKTLNT